MSYGGQLKLRSATLLSVVLLSFVAIGSLAFSTSAQAKKAPPISTSTNLSLSAPAIAYGSEQTEMY